MRIISFSQKWNKLQLPEFTTFRYPRVDKDWYVGEVVQVWFKQRTPYREKLGEATIINKEIRDLDPHFKDEFAIVTDEEAQADGFFNRVAMEQYMQKQYGLNYISLMNKLTLRWL